MAQSCAVLILLPLLLSALQVNPVDDTYYFLSVIEPVVVWLLKILQLGFYFSVSLAKRSNSFYFVLGFSLCTFPGASSDFLDYKIIEEYICCT